MIEVYDLASIEADPALRIAMHELRYRQFRLKQQWDVPAVKGVEIDQYDRQAVDPIYLIARNDRGELIGTCRLLRTTGPYMIRDHFAHMMGEREAPADQQVWEANRIAVDATKMKNRRQALSVTGAILAATCEFGIPRGMKETLGTYETQMIRLLKARGAPPSWIGPDCEFADSKCAIAAHDINWTSYQRVIEANDLPTAVITADRTIRSEEAA